MCELARVDSTPGAIRELSKRDPQTRNTGFLRSDNDEERFGRSSLSRSRPHNRSLVLPAVVRIWKFRAYFSMTVKHRRRVFRGTSSNSKIPIRQMHEDNSECESPRN